MRRKALSDLKKWKERSNRKPLIIRGARQVGKTYLAREFGEECFQKFIEINFDRNPEKSKLFTGGIKNTLNLLELDNNTTIIPGSTLLFLDEIQAAPEILPLLRYFYEEYPDLHVIAAGSLLEFLLEEHNFSMPVGRIEYLHLGPMDIEELLIASGEERLITYLNEYSLNDVIPESIHQKYMHYLKLFMVIGGMPAAVGAYLDSGDVLESTREHESILQTYEDDFSRYRKKIYPQRLRKVFRKIPSLIGNKLKYVNLDPEEKSRDLADSLYLLSLAKVIYKVRHSSGNGTPLGAEAKEKDFKPLFLDVGLVSTSLGLSLPTLYSVENILLVNNGAIAEQFIGQHLLYAKPGYENPQLFYWNREKRNSSAEVDYLTSFENKVIPVEVKSGATGALKSLHLFAAEKKSPVAVRFNAMPPSCVKLESASPNLEKQPFSFLSLPLYLVGQTERLLAEALMNHDGDHG